MHVLLLQHLLPALALTRYLMHACAGLANKLLRLSTRYQLIQGIFWSALSVRLTELSVSLALQGPEPLRLEVLNQLSSLTYLAIDMCGDADQNRCEDGEEVADSHAVSLPRLKSLHMTQVITEDLNLECPELRSLIMEDCRIRGNLIIPACLEEFSLRGTPPMHDASAVRNLLALTSLACCVAGNMKQDLLYGFLPLMPVLRSLDLKLSSGQLPPQLPVSLQVVNTSSIVEHHCPLGSSSISLTLLSYQRSRALPCRMPTHGRHGRRKPSKRSKPVTRPR